MEKMRTRFLPKMTHDEVCEYVKRNDIIYVPFGTVEVPQEAFMSVLKLDD